MERITIRKQIDAGGIDEVADYVLLADYEKLQAKNAKIIQDCLAYNRKALEGCSTLEAENTKMKKILQIVLEYGEEGLTIDESFAKDIKQLLQGE